MINVRETRGDRLPDHLLIDGQRFNILNSGETTKYLGRKVSFEDYNSCEFDNRVAAAWGAFSRHKKELTDRRYQLRDRLKLLDAVVTSTLLYGCETWALRVDQIRRLKAAQWKMARMIINAKRRSIHHNSSSESGNSTEDEKESISTDLETWQDFMKRTAQWADEQLEQCKVAPWIENWGRRKWKWAAKLYEEGNRKWSAVATAWQPMIHSSAPCGRRQARPRKRWDQDYTDYIRAAAPDGDAHWRDMAKNTQEWLSLQEDFATASK